MSFAFTEIPKDQIRIPGENYFHTITPYFQHMNLLNEQQSEIQGKAVYEIKEMVQMRFSGDRYYSPCFPVDSMYRKVGVNEITFAERWADQYRAFLNNEAQVAEGTPLDELISYGITPSQLSLCRALKIYSIEALYHLEGPNLKSLGIHANDLKPMAKRYMEARANGSKQDQEIARLKAEIEAMKAGNVLPADEHDGLGEVLKNDEYLNVSDAELKDMIAAKAGKRPLGNPSRETLVSMLRDLNAA